MDFFSMNITGLIDILIVGVLMYQIYKMIKGTSAFSIFIGIFIFYVSWIVVRSFNMELLSSIMGQIIGVGVIALIVVFQQEIRRLLLYFGNRYFDKFSHGLGSSLAGSDETGYIDEIVTACENMGAQRVGALIVFTRRSNLNLIQDTGDVINAKISHRLIETIFFKNSPLHDGAMIISNGRISAARCVLPQTERNDIPASLGMRHRAAIGVSAATHPVVVVVSEQTGRISYVDKGILYSNLSAVVLKEKLVKIL